MNKIQMKDIAENPTSASRIQRDYSRIRRTYPLFTFLQEYRVERSLEFLPAPMTALWKSPRNRLHRLQLLCHQGILQSKGLQPRNTGSRIYGKICEIIYRLYYSTETVFCSRYFFNEETYRFPTLLRIEFFLVI